MKDKIGKDIVGLLFSFLQKKPGRISRDALALASCCHCFWQVATTCPDLHAGTRTLFTAIVDYDTDPLQADSIYKKPATSFCFNGIAESWKRSPFPAFLSYEQCLAQIQKNNKPKKYLIFEVKLARADLAETAENACYQVDPAAMVSTAIQKVSLIYSLSRPIFLTAEKGVLPGVDRTKIHHPADFDNPTYAEPSKRLGSLDNALPLEASGLNTLKELRQDDLTSQDLESKNNHCCML